MLEITAADLANPPAEVKKMVFLRISNKGVMEPEAMLLLGASTKRGDSTKIGFFGSGLKYALAVLLRNKIHMHIFAGMNEIKITTEDIKFREQSFSRILVNGQPTSMTTEMGVDWEPWFALRELLCNAIDEGEHEISVVDEILPIEGRTVFYIAMTENMMNVFQDWNKFFCEKRPDVVLQVGNNRVFVGSDFEFIVYRKGVRCHYNKHLHSLYHYDFDWVKINESRVIQNEFEFQIDITKWIAKNADEEMARNILDNWKGNYEGKLDWHWTSIEFSDAWLSVINGRDIVPEDVAGYFTEFLRDGALKLPNSLCKGLKEFYKDKVHIVGMSDDKGGKFFLEPTERQTKMLEEVKEFLLKADINIKATIKICKFRQAFIHGEANNDDNEIYLSPDVFIQGKRYLLLVLVEEMCHLDSGAPDNSRRFQDYLINQFVTSLEERTGILL